MAVWAADGLCIKASAVFTVAGTIIELGGGGGFALNPGLRHFTALHPKVL